MSESKSHKLHKRKAAGKSGKTEVKLPGGRRLDAATKNRATEIERSGNFDRILQAAKRLKASRKNQHVLKVPHKDMPKARKALRQLGISGTVKNMGETAISRIAKKKR